MPLLARTFFVQRNGTRLRPAGLTSTHCWHCFGSPCPNGRAVLCFAQNTAKTTRVHPINGFCARAFCNYRDGNCMRHTGAYNFSSLGAFFAFPRIGRVNFALSGETAKNPRVDLWHSSAPYGLDKCSLPALFLLEFPLWQFDFALRAKYRKNNACAKLP